MKKYEIPEKNGDLKSYAIFGRIKSIASYILYILFFASAFWFYLVRRHENAARLSIWVYILFPIAVLLSGWFVCRMHLLVKDVYVCGKIKSIKYTRDYGRGIDRRASVIWGFHTYLKITVEDDKGKKRKVTVPLFPDGFGGYYKEGYTFIKLQGLNYPIAQESLREGVLLCTVCGVRTYRSEIEVNGAVAPKRIDGKYICRSCEHSLIEKI